MSPDFKHKRGHKIHYVEQGEGPNIVFAHGYVMDHTMYAAQFEELPSTHRCVALDLRGHGHSDCPEGEWKIGDLVSDVIDFIESVASPCHLVGMSLGGFIAVRVALERPDLLTSLVMIDSSADGLDPSWVEPYAGFAQTIEADGVTEELARQTLPLFYANAFIEQNPDVMDYHVDRVTHMKKHAQREGLRVIAERGSVLDRLGEIRLPTLAIHGAEDASIPVADAQELVDGVRGAKLLTIPGAGHTTPIEAPDVVNEALASFFSS
jgi:3-oxoadipate enol-lactonase